LQFNDRPPYSMRREDGSVVGVVASEAERVFNAAGVPFVWTLSSTKRQWYTFQKTTVQSCAVGWFKTPEREQFAKFTKPIYRDKTMVIIARNDFVIPDNAKLEDILVKKGVRVSLKANYSYGPIIDDLLKKLKPIEVQSDVEVRQMILLLKANRADIMFAAEEEARYLLGEVGSASQDLHIATPVGMPNGEFRYIVCNKTVSDDVINRLNGAINVK
jgi:polar amino acid transport system substrate-binding protein